LQIGDNPGRARPGTGEINYPFIFKELRRLNWTGFVDTEHGTSSTADLCDGRRREVGRGQLTENGQSFVA
jgi:hydroxypyruvate isomerase